ncbi:MAG TPA: lipopolysaccharide biosynthesis protein, partial [Acidimicrobiales bacterium]|nr:lipopolysaccharide biosynthesis protein [Acidimicrobiales bacterium]
MSRRGPAWPRNARGRAGAPPWRGWTQSAFSHSLLAGLASQGVLVISGPLVARLLGVQGRGALAFVTVVALICSQVFGAGLSTSVSYHLARQPVGARSGLWRYVPLWLCLLMAAGLTTDSVLVAAGTERLGSWFLVAAGLLAPVLMIQQMAMAILQGERRFGEFNLLRVLPALFYAMATAVLYLFVGHASVLAVLACSVAAGAGAGVLAARGIRRGPASPTPVTIDAPGLLRYGLLSLVGTAAPLTTLNPDQVLVGLVLSTRDLGLYVVACAFANLTPLLLHSIGMIAEPRLAAASSDAARRTITVRVCALGVMVGCGATVAVLAIMPLAVRVFFGAPFAGAVP